MNIPITMTVAIAVLSVSYAAIGLWAVFATMAALLRLDLHGASDGPDSFPRDAQRADGVPQWSV